MGAGAAGRELGAASAVPEQSWGPITRVERLGGVDRQQLLLRFTGTQLLGGREAAGVKQARAKAELVRWREGSAAWHARLAVCP